MDATVRQLLVELARTTLRVLEGTSKSEVEQKPTPVSVAAIPEIKVEQKPAAGTVVRVWTGDRYEVGKVERLCRGLPWRVWVRVSRGEGRRAKRVQVEWARCALV
jgi:hypothetical protein